MLCQNCQKKDATFFYKESVNGKTKSYALCASCAAAMKQNGKIKTTLSQPAEYDALPFSAGSVFDSLFSNLFGIESPQSRHNTTMRCPLCGATFSDLAKEGKTGCPRCYETFADALAPSIRRIHGDAAHTGRVPKRWREKLGKASRREKLKAELDAAVQAQEFERAAELRDELRALGD